MLYFTEERNKILEERGVLKQEYVKQFVVPLYLQGRFNTKFERGKAFLNSMTDYVKENFDTDLISLVHENAMMMKNALSEEDARSTKAIFNLSNRYVATSLKGKYKKRFFVPIRELVSGYIILMVRNIEEKPKEKLKEK